MIRGWSRIKSFSVVNKRFSLSSDAISAVLKLWWSPKDLCSKVRAWDSKKSTKQYYVESDDNSVAADPVVAYMTKDQLNKLLNQTQRGMEKAAKELDFMEAARLRDELLEIKKMIADKK